MCKPGHEERAKEITYKTMREAKDKGYSNHDIAEHTGSKEKTIEHANYGYVPSFAVWLAIFILIKPIEILKILAEYCGCIVFRLPTPKGDIKSITEKTAKVMRETADVISTGSVVVADGKVDKWEKEDMRKEIDEAITALVQLRMEYE